jgi:hypothetical protein
VVSELVQPCTLAAFGDRRVTFAWKAPELSGDYTLEASLFKSGTPRTRSLRDFRVK